MCDELQLRAYKVPAGVAEAAAREPAAPGSLHKPALSPGAERRLESSYSALLGRFETLKRESLRAPPPPPPPPPPGPALFSNPNPAKEPTRRAPAPATQLSSSAALRVGGAPVAGHGPSGQPSHDHAPGDAAPSAPPDPWAALAAAPAEPAASSAAEASPSYTEAASEPEVPHAAHCALLVEPAVPPAAAAGAQAMLPSMAAATQRDSIMMLAEPPAPAAAESKAAVRGMCACVTALHISNLMKLDVEPASTRSKQSTVKLLVIRHGAQAATWACAGKTTLTWKVAPGRPVVEAQLYVAL